MTQTEHRKRLRRFNLPGQARELTFSTSGRKPLLQTPGIARFVLESLTAAMPTSDFSLLAFVVMPEHVHLLLVAKPGVEAPDTGRLLSAVKRRSSYEIKRLLQQQSDSQLVDELTSVRTDRAVFRLWLPGGGYDRNLLSISSIAASLDYMHNNPVKRGLCRTPIDYEWSSARQWLEPDRCVPEWMPKVDRRLL